MNELGQTAVFLMTLCIFALVLALIRKRKITEHFAVLWVGISIGLGGLLAWQATTVLRVHLSYLPYFNELVGGPDNGWQYVNDSNLDWGQDVKRLAQFVEERGIPAIQVDAFGPADAAFYLKD